MLDKDKGPKLKLPFCVRNLRLNTDPDYREASGA